MTMTPYKADHYSAPDVNRRFFLADALIHLKSYRWGDIDYVADHLTDAEVAAVHKAVAMLNDVAASEEFV
jgi:hypothetical protein